jgi:hypothetical protein
LPTNLPRPQAIPKRSVFSVVLNTFMLSSALALTFLVLVQEQRFAMGQPGYFADTIAQWTQPADSERDGK